MEKEEFYQTPTADFQTDQQIAQKRYHFGHKFLISFVSIFLAFAVLIVFVSPQEDWMVSAIAQLCCQL